MGLKDRTTGDVSIKVFGSRTKGTHTAASDLDMAVIVYNTEVFTTDRVQKILKSIQDDFYKETKIKLDINIIEPTDLPLMKFDASDLKDF